MLNESDEAQAAYELERFAKSEAELPLKQDPFRGTTIWRGGEKIAEVSEAKEAEFIVCACNEYYTLKRKAALRDELARVARLAYIRLLSLGEYKGRSTAQGQHELSALRDAISAATNTDAETVQTECEQAALLSKAGA